jgi:ribosomal-protein-alanine N-acetyltransferase
VGPFPIESERLLLREFRAEDEAAVHAYARNPEVTRFTSWGPNDLADTKAFIKASVAEGAQWPRESVPLAIELKAEGRLIGGTGFYEIHSAVRTATFGYVLDHPYWGRGLATEASRALLDFCFRVVRLHRVVARCDVRHRASFHVMEKLGMRREAHFRKDTKKAGEWCDTYLYAVLDEEWNETTTHDLQA